MDMTKSQIDEGTKFFEIPKVDNGNPVIADLVNTGTPYFTTIEKIALTTRTPEVLNALAQAKLALRESFQWAHTALGYAIKGGAGNNA